MIAIFGTLFFLTLAAPSDSCLLTPEKIDIIRAGQEAIFDSRWDEASAIFDSLRSIDNTDPAAFLFPATVLQAEMIDREDETYGRRFLRMLDSVAFYANRRLSHCSRRDSAVCFLYLGHQAAYRSLFEARFGSRFAALTLGLKAKGYYQDGLAADSTLYDLYLGLGSYHYWKSVKAGLLRTAGIFSDDRLKGISEIKLAIDSSYFSSQSARAAMIWIFIEEKKYDSAIALCSRLLSAYPDGNNFLWPLAESFFKDGDYEKAADIYYQLLQRLKTKPGNYFNVIESAYWYRRACENLKFSDKIKEIKLYINSIIKSIPKEIRYRQKSRLAYLVR
ncbi:hypothetical protein TRIP_C20285 [Candidatus Zixiibacteriota bacterium]|nr:hypothetical protein TRIP_C20285 [candidate division Zixibacteria bacterium]